MKTPPKSLDTPTIDEILDELGEAYHNSYPDKKAHQRAKQALLQWHKDKARSYVPEKKTSEYTAKEYGQHRFDMGHNACADQTLKAIEESK